MPSSSITPPWEPANIMNEPKSSDGMNGVYKLSALEEFFARKHGYSAHCKKYRNGDLQNVLGSWIVCTAKKCLTT